MMKLMSIILFVAVAFVYSSAQQATASENYLAVDAPSFFVDQPSPLAKPKESLQKKEYFDFLSTLYRHDRTKSSLFEDKVELKSPITTFRKKRTIYFRPLFAYRQQQIKRQRKGNRY